MKLHFMLHSKNNQLVNSTLLINLFFVFLYYNIFKSGAEPTQINDSTLPGKAMGVMFNNIIAIRDLIMNCKNCHSSNVNVSKSNLPLLPRLFIYAIAGSFVYVGITNISQGFLFIIVAFAFAAGIYFFGKKLVAISYYCNNCRKKWSVTEFD